MTAHIALENVSLTFAAKPQPFTVLEDISLALSPGGIYCAAWAIRLWKIHHP